MNDLMKVRFRGEEMAVADAKMELTREELAEVEATREDGTVYNPFRDYDPEMSTDENGQPGI
jgi:hypothetical protein